MEREWGGGVSTPFSNWAWFLVNASHFLVNDLLPAAFSFHSPGGAVERSLVRLFSPPSLASAVFVGNARSLASHSTQTHSVGTAWRGAAGRVRGSERSSAISPIVFPSLRASFLLDGDAPAGFVFVSRPSLPRQEHVRACVCSPVVGKLDRKAAALRVVSFFPTRAAAARSSENSVSSAEVTGLLLARLARLTSLFFSLSFFAQQTRSQQQLKSDHS